MSAPIHVLVVDDDDDVREALALLLEIEGFRVSTASDGRAALDALGAEPRPDAMLLDLRMPVMTGWEVIEQLQREGRLGEVAIVVCTSSPADAPKGLPLLPKPVDLPRTLAMLRSAARPHS